MSEAVSGTQDLTVRGESIERVYSGYRERNYLVNRRYQRKLIWTFEEKVSFIDSIIHGYPVPIILLAENRTSEVASLEIIDGMQRMNAVMSFIENEFSVAGTYFDLNTMATSKKLMDDGKLVQRTPVMSREQCVQIARYQLPFSIYEFSQEANVDEVFRRINSGGRQLSRQELRAAGATGRFAESVRRIAARVRGDSSHSDVLVLNEMRKISITNRELNYGIAVDDVFWVKHGILSKDQVRQSRDEEQIADILAYMASDEPVPSRTEFLDDYFGMGEDPTSQERYEKIEASVQKRTQSLLINDFQRVFDELLLTVDASGEPFNRLVLSAAPAISPRYFQAIFLAFYELIVRQNKEVANRADLVRRLHHSGDHIEMQEGGRWGAEQRQRAIDTAIGMYQGAFAKSHTVDPAIVHWVTQLQNILSQSYTEQNAYDFKQGFLRLDDGKSFDEDSFQKILQTCVGIANIRKGYRGYVIVGVADRPADAQRVEQLYGTQPRSYEGFYIVGVDREAEAMGKSLDQLFQLVVNKVRASKLSEPIKDYIARHLKSVRYYDKTVYVFEVSSQDDPSSYDGKYYVRHGAQLAETPPAELPALIRRYDRGL